MKEIIFIGGFENTGTRILVNYLLKKGYKTTKTNNEMDYQGLHFLKLFDIYWFNNNSAPLIAQLRKDIEGIEVDKIVIKHGHFNFLVDELKKEFPNSYFINCIRNPYDILVKPSHNYARYARKGNPTIRGKFNFLRLWYSNNILNGSDCIVRMEDLVFNTLELLKSLDKSIGCASEERILNEFRRTIKPSRTIGKGKMLMEKESDGLVGEINDFCKIFCY